MSTMPGTVRHEACIGVKTCHLAGGGGAREGAPPTCLYRHFYPYGSTQTGIRIRSNLLAL